MIVLLVSLTLAGCSVRKIITEPVDVITKDEREPVHLSKTAEHKQQLKITQWKKATIPQQ